MNEQQIAALLTEQVPPLLQRGERVLPVVPDTTRTASMAMLMGKLLPGLRQAGVHTRVLVALGTYPPLTRDTLTQHLGIDLDGDVPALNHAWNDPGQLESVGVLSAEEVQALSAGLMAESVDLRINRELIRADRVLLLHPVFPHELVGFSGGSKYLFPGISGPGDEHTHLRERISGNGIGYGHVRNAHGRGDHGRGIQSDST